MRDASGLHLTAIDTSFATQRSLELLVKAKSPRVTRVIYELDGKEYVARPASADEKRAVKTKLLEGGLSESCECGEEFCDGEWVWRCMYAGAEECDWFITYEVCETTKR